MDSNVANNTSAAMGDQVAPEANMLSAIENTNNVNQYVSGPEAIHGAVHKNDLNVHTSSSQDIATTNMTTPVVDTSILDTQVTGATQDVTMVDAASVQTGNDIVGTQNINQVTSATQDVAMADATSVKTGNGITGTRNISQDDTTSAQTGAEMAVAQNINQDQATGATDEVDNDDKTSDDYEPYEFYCMFEQGCPDQRQRKLCESRKCVSNFFGRNKKCTLQIPRQIIWCRSHYQKVAYNKPQWARRKLVMIAKQLELIEEDVPNTTYTISLKQSEQKRLNAFNNSKGAKNVDNPKDNTYKSSIAVLQHIYDNFLGPHKTPADIQVILDWVLERLEKGDTDDVPSFECLPEFASSIKIRPENEIRGAINAPTEATLALTKQVVANEDVLDVPVISKNAAPLDLTALSTSAETQTVTPAAEASTTVAGPATVTSDTNFTAINTVAGPSTVASPSIIASNTNTVAGPSTVASDTTLTAVTTASSSKGKAVVKNIKKTKKVQTKGFTQTAQITSGFLAKSTTPASAVSTVTQTDDLSFLVASAQTPKVSATMDYTTPGHMLNTGSTADIVSAQPATVSTGMSRAPDAIFDSGASALTTATTPGSPLEHIAAANNCGTKRGRDTENEDVTYNSADEGDHSTADTRPKKAARVTRSSTAGSSKQ